MSEPVAWRVYDTDGSEAVYCTGEEARAAAYEMNWSIEPLYRSPPLTNEEREALLYAAEVTAGLLHVYDDERPSFDISDALRGIRERLN